MHLCLYHDAVIPPAQYGGTERIIAWLAQALIQSGVKVTLIARPGSNVPGVRLVALQNEAMRRNWQEYVPPDVDLLHLWCTPSEKIRKPYLVTIEGNGQPGENFHANTVFISKKHAENHGGKVYVYNGINPDDYLSDEKREDRLVFLAKASWAVKNLEGAVEIARAAGMPLDVMGSWSFPGGFQKWLRIRGVRFFGMVGDPAKKQVLRSARALLFPVRWHEPFGIAITEALASGCAVLGTPYGSLPEIITRDVGFLSAKASDHVDWLKSRPWDKGAISPKSCRNRVFQGFTHRDMAQAYLAHYRSILEKGCLLEDPESALSKTAGVALPKTKDGFNAQDLLAWN